MEVDGREHHVARDDERFQRDDAARVDAECEGARVLEDPKRRDELLHIVRSPDRTREVAIAQEVVHAIGVEIGTADEFAQDGIAAGGIPRDEREDVGGIDLDALERATNVFRAKDRCRADFVRHAEHRLAGVAERAVPDVVEEQARAQEPPLSREFRVVFEIVAAVDAERCQNPFADRECAEHVSESGVFGCGKGEVGEPELPQASEALDGRRIQEGDFGVVERDESMDRVEDALHPVAFAARGGSVLSLREATRVLIVLKNGGNAMSVGDDPCSTISRGASPRAIASSSFTAEGRRSMRRSRNARSSHRASAACG